METEITFQNLLEYRAERTPDKIAVYDMPHKITYHDLYEETRQMTIALSKLNIQKGDRVLTILPNWHEFMILMFACARVGGIVVPCNAAAVETDIQYLLQKIRPKVVFLYSPHQLLWMKGYDQSITVITVRFEQKECKSFDSLIRTDTHKLGQPDLVPIDPEQDVLAIMSSSGTTGYPKGVEITQASVLQFAATIGNQMECTDRDIAVNPLPNNHLFGMIIGLTVPIYFGGTAVLIQSFDANQILTMIEEQKISILHGVPSMFIRELEEYKQNPKSVTSLRTGIMAGAGCPTHVIQEIFSILHCNIIVAYGSTEAGVVAMTSLEDSIKTRCETIGKAVKGVQIKIVNDRGDPVRPGEIGELLCQGPMVMKRYYQMPDETKRAFDEDGWFCTGDLVTIDALGYLRIVGRKKEMVIRGGENIYPAEIEKVYNMHRSVMEVCMLGFPHKVLGEQTYVFIQLEDTSKETEESLRDYAQGKLAKYKIPDKVVLLHEMPHLPGGKIDKKTLRNMFSNFALQK